MTDDFVRAARRLLPPEVDLVVLPAVRGGPVDVSPEEAQAGVAAARALVVRTLHAEWAAAAGGLPTPGEAIVECVQASDDGQLVAVTALGRHVGLGDGDVLERLEAATARLAAHGWTARRRDPGPATYAVEARRGELTLTVTAWTSAPAYDVGVQSADVPVGKLGRDLLHDPVAELPWPGDD